MSGIQARKIVVPIDFSDESFAALDVALDIAASPSHVHVVHVIPELNAAEPGVIWQQINNENRSKHATEAMRARLSGEKYKQVQVEIEIGDPAYRIAAYAKRSHADLVVIPSHGRTGLAHMLIGSVAERVVRHSHCPVLVLRKQPAK